MKRLYVLLPIVAAIVLPEAAQAQDNEAVLAAPQVFALAEAYRREGRVEDAEALLDALTRDREPEIRAEARFRLGRSRMARGDYGGAVDAFAALLAEKPNAQPARLALAQALLFDGKTGAAARQLRRAQAGGLPEDVQRLVDRFSDVLRRSRPYGVNVEVGIAPDSNINQATDSRTLDIGGLPLVLDESGRATSGVGLTASADAFATLPLGSGLSWISRVAGIGSFYGREQFNDIVVSASSGPEFALGRTVVRPAATYSWRQFGGRRYSYGFGGSLQVLAPVGKASQVGGSISISDQRYRIPEQDGVQLSATVSYEAALSPRLYGRVEAMVQRVNAEADPYASTSFGGSVSLSRDISAATIYAQAGYLRIEGDAPFALFGKARADDRVDLSVGAAWKRLSIAGLTPVVRLRQTFNSSPLDLYRFERTRIEVVLAERF
jgi:hypothetical protein